MGFIVANLFHSLLLLFIIFSAILAFISKYTDAYSIPCLSETTQVKGLKQPMKTNVAFKGNSDLLNEERKSANMPSVGLEVDNYLREVRGHHIILGDFNDDDICGGYDKDYIDSGSGNDLIVGSALGDVLVGFEGSDSISSNDNKNTGPDGYTDEIDCGPGEDEAWINVSVDGDLAVNCEILHTG